MEGILSTASLALFEESSPFLASAGRFLLTGEVGLRGHVRGADFIGVRREAEDGDAAGDFIGAKVPVGAPDLRCGDLKLSG